MHASTFVFTDLRYLHVRITCTHSPLSGYAVVALEDSVQVPGHDAIEQGIEHKEDERKVCWRKVKLRGEGEGKIFIVRMVTTFEARFFSEPLV